MSSMDAQKEQGAKLAKHDPFGKVKDAVKKPFESDSGSANADTNEPVGHGGKNYGGNEGHHGMTASEANPEDANTKAPTMMGMSAHPAN